MLIDWFTVIAQAANFLILVWLLKRFLYQPILNAIDAREKRIAAELADANAKKAEAQTEREEYQRKNDEFDRQLASLKNKAVDEAAAERTRLFEEARKDAEGLRAKRMEMLDSEFQTLNAEIARRARVEVFAIARKALADLAGVNLEEHMAEIFVQRLRKMDAAEKGLLTASFTPSAPVLVRSAFELPPGRCTLIEEALKEILSASSAQVRFEIAPELINGIELVVQGRKVAWCIADYLAALDKSVSELLKTQRKEGTGSTAPAARKGNGQ